VPLLLAKKLMDLHPAAIANHFGLYLNEPYQLIHPLELFGQLQTKSPTHHLAPHVVECIDRFNRTTTFVAATLLRISGNKERATAMTKFITAASFLCDLQHFEAVFAIMGGLSQMPVRRLAGTQSELKSGVAKQYKDLEALVSVASNNSAYRDVVQAVDHTAKPCQPYIGVVLKDLLFAEDGNPKFVDGKVNFFRCAMQHSVAYSFLRHQTGFGRAYTFEAANGKRLVRRDLIKLELGLGFQCPSDNDLWDLSYAVVPRKRRN
jgi:son of sevenless-like protein